MEFVDELPKTISGKIKRRSLAIFGTGDYYQVGVFCLRNKGLFINEVIILGLNGCLRNDDS